MNDMKINMVKFLMTMFKTNIETINDIELFKCDVDELVHRNQISSSTRNIVYSMFGIMNTNVFKPKQQEEKLAQIESMMRLLERIRVSGDASALNRFKDNIENGVKQGTISKSARDIIFEIYDLDIINNKVNTQVPKVSDLGPVLGVQSQGVKSPLNKTNDKNKKSKEVLADIAQFKSQYVPEIYYEYPNPNFDGCSGSSRDLHVKLIDVKVRPVGAKLVIRKLLHDDGCHQSWGFVSVPAEYYKPTTVPTTRIKTPTTGSAVGCTGGGYSMRTC